MSTKKRRITFYGTDRIYQWYQTLPQMKRGKLLVELLEAAAAQDIDRAQSVTGAVTPNKGPNVAEIIRQQQQERKRLKRAEPAEPESKNLTFDDRDAAVLWLRDNWELDELTLQELADFSWQHNGEFPDGDALVAAFNER